MVNLSLLLLLSATLYGSGLCQSEISSYGSFCFISVVRGATFEKNAGIWGDMVFKLWSTPKITLAKQKSIVKTFMGNKWKQMGHATKAAATAKLPAMNAWLAAHSRMVNYYKGLLAKLKTKLPASMFEKTRNSFWNLEAAYMNYVDNFFPKAWTDWCFGKFINKTAAQTTFTNVLNNYRAEYEKKNPGMYAADAQLSVVKDYCY